MEATIATAVVATVALGLFGWIGVTRWSHVDAQALIAARAIAAREVDTLQALCRDRLADVIATGSGAACGYLTPLNAWVPAPEYGVPGLAYRVEVAPVDAGGGSASYDLAQVTVTVRWERPFVARVQGRREFKGFVYGHSTLYWEDWQEWLGR